MKILAPGQLKAVERETVEKQRISMADLMERAATAVFNRLNQVYDISKTAFVIFCGAGNNGGDGLALARLLKGSGSDPKVYLRKSKNYSEDNLKNQISLKNSGVEICYFDSLTVMEFPENAVIIDAIIGYGLNRPVEGDLKFVIDKINHSGCRIISVDLPSGLFCDQLNSNEDSVIHCDLCLTFDSPKFSMLLPENFKNLNRFEILDIGFDKNSVDTRSSDLYFTDLEMVSGFKKERNRFAYKYNFGNVLIIGGSYGKMGAMQLSARAAMRCGAGLVTAYIPKCGYQNMQASVPEVLVWTDFSNDKITGFPETGKYDTFAVGSGLGTDEKTAYGFEQFLTENDLNGKKMIVDADGINLISKNRNLLSKLPANTIITPHDKELERLIGSWKDSFEKFEKIRQLTNEFQLIVVSKGAFSQIHLPDGTLYFNSTGNPGMATAGSGDVLTGMVAGLTGRGYEPKDAAILSVYLHGLSGDLAVEKAGQESLIATDLLEFIPKAFKKAFG